MHPNIFELIKLCVEQGIALGIEEVYEDIEGPSKDQIREAATQSVMDEIHKYFWFEDPVE